MRNIREAPEGKRVWETAYAKINLSLDVVGRLADGYHEVRMVMQTVDIRDELFLERTGEAGDVVLEMCGDAEISLGPDNLICRAAETLRACCGITEGVRITLEKHIPVAAGMAGGSADAAAALRGMNRLFGCGLTDERLCGLGVRIGADVPYCVLGGTMLAEGIGERLTRLPDAPKLILAIAKPEVGVSTKFVYEGLDQIAGWSEAGRKEDVKAAPREASVSGALRRPLEHPDVDAMLSAIRASDAGAIAASLGNILEAVTVSAYPMVGEIKERFRAAGAEGVLMSGSGPTVFAVFKTHKEAQSAVEDIRAAGLSSERESFVTGVSNGRR